jgi:hypothetical protein
LRRCLWIPPQVQGKPAPPRYKLASLFPAPERASARGSPACGINIQSPCCTTHHASEINTALGAPALAKQLLFTGIDYKSITKSGPEPRDGGGVGVWLQVLYLGLERTPQAVEKSGCREGSGK